MHASIIKFICTPINSEPIGCIYLLIVFFNITFECLSTNIPLFNKPIKGTTLNPHDSITMGALKTIQYTTLIEATQSMIIGRLKRFPLNQPYIFFYIFPIHWSLIFFYFLY